MAETKAKNRLFSADFETTTDKDDCRVWAWSVTEIGNPNYFVYGNSIDTFFDFMEKSNNATFYFHNLKFDSEFLFVWLFERGFTVNKPELRETNNGEQKYVTVENEHSFSTLISDKGQFYSVKIIFKKTKKQTTYATIYDSLKLLPFSVRDVAKGFGLPISKLHLDYNTYREIGHELTPREIDYIRNDVDIVSRALKTLFDEGMTKMTTAGNALYNYKKIIGEREFNKRFPQLHCDADIRKTYKGGFTYCPPKIRGHDVTEGIVLDVNSLYPWAMYYCPLPYGEPIFFDGQYTKDDFYPLYTQRILASFKLKDGYIPTIGGKSNSRFIATEYVESSFNPITNIYDKVELWLTSVDLEMFLEHYEIFEIDYIDGWKFRASTTLFRDYIDYWMGVKIQATIDGNKAMRTLAKLMLNSLYGKFGKNPKSRSKYPVYNDGAISYEYGEEENGKPIYIPVASFITAWARYKTITSAQKVYPYFRYADTDSLHLEMKLPSKLKNMSVKDMENLTTKDLQEMGLPIPHDFIVDPVELGAWKVEMIFHRARYIRAKTYIEDVNTPETWECLPYNSKEFSEICDDLEIDKSVLNNYKNYYDTSKLKITCAGMPTNCYQHVTWGNFHEGASYSGKLMPKHVKGGIVLVDTDFTIKKTNKRLVDYLTKREKKRKDEVSNVIKRMKELEKTS